MTQHLIVSLAQMRVWSFHIIGNIFHSLNIAAREKPA